MIAPINDFRDAINWRLCGIPHETVQHAARAAHSLLSRYEGHPSDGKGMAAILDGFDIRPKGNLASYFYALAAVGAEFEGDRDTFYQAAAIVRDAHRQSQRAKRQRSYDSLDRMIAALIVEVDGISPAAIWKDFIHQAESSDGHLDDYDQRSGLLSYQAKPHDDDVTCISYSTFRRRVQRLRKQLGPNTDGMISRDKFALQDDRIVEIRLQSGYIESQKAKSQPIRIG
jgi:hypothetical protein